jgi:HK97 family phage portal protein
VNLLARVFSRKSAGTPMSSASFAELLSRVWGGGSTKSGASVSVDTALQVSSVLACMRVLAEGVAQVPWRVMQEKVVGSRVERHAAPKHPLYRVLWRRANQWQTSFELRETMVYHAGLTGNGYAFKSRVGRDQRIAELVVLPPNRVRVEVTIDSTMLYHVTGRNGEQRTLTQDDVWHLRGPSWDGLVGMNVLNLAREAVGLSMVAEESQARLHQRGVRTSGVYSLEGTLKEDQYSALKKWIEREFSGMNAGAPMILDRSAKWQPMTMTGVDAQHLETRRHQIQETCRFFRVMPIMIGHDDKANTYGSAEQMFIAHLVHTLSPWYERIEQSADCQLLSDEDLENGFYTLLDGAGMLRGALKDTAEYIAKLTERGVMTRNEGRGLIDLNPLEGLDAPLTPVNLSPVIDRDPPANSN